MEERKRSKKGAKNDRKKYNNFIEHTAGETDSCQPGQKKISCILLYTINIITFTGPPLVPSLSQMNFHSTL